MLSASVIVSCPSEVSYAVISSVLLSVVPTTNAPVRLAQPISSLDIPEIVYGKDVPEGTLPVVSVNVTLPP